MIHLAGWSGFLSLVCREIIEVRLAVCRCTENSGKLKLDSDLFQETSLFCCPCSVYQYKRNVKTYVLKNVIISH